MSCHDFFQAGIGIQQGFGEALAKDIEGGLKFERVDHRLALIVVVSDDVQIIDLLLHGHNFIHPGGEFLLAVEVIVPVIAAGILIEPLFRVASVEAHVGEGGGHLGGGGDAVFQVRLVYVAEGDAPFAQSFKEFGDRPGVVPHFHAQGQPVQHVGEPPEVGSGGRGALETPGKLEQHGAQFAGFDQRIHAVAERGGTVGVGRFAALVGEPGRCLDGEAKLWVRFGLGKPGQKEAGRYGPVVGDVDFHQVHPLADQGEGMAAGFGIDNTLPVRVRPARRADEDSGASVAVFLYGNHTILGGGPQKRDRLRNSHHKQIAYNEVYCRRFRSQSLIVATLVIHICERGYFGNPP